MNLYILSRKANDSKHGHINMFLIAERNKVDFL